MSEQLMASSSGEMKPEWISVQRAAVLLEVHENTIYSWIHSGHLIGIRCGPKVIRIPRTEIARMRIAGTIRHSTS